MNKSLDERLIPNGEYVDALNVRLGSTEETEIGAVEVLLTLFMTTTKKWSKIMFYDLRQWMRTTMNILL